MTAHEQQSDVRARRKSVHPKFEVELEIEMEMGHSWNKRGYRLQHQHFQERPTINEKKNPRAQSVQSVQFPN